MSEKKGPAREKEEDQVQFGDELPVLPIRNAVLFPGAVAPFDVGREKSVALVEDVDNFPAPVIAIFAQKDPATDDPGAEETVERWANRAGCNLGMMESGAPLDLESVVPGTETDVGIYQIGCAPEIEVELWRINGGTHVPMLSVDFADRVLDWSLR